MKAGIITGKEAPTQIAGLVVAGATAGLPATIDFVKNSAGNVANAIGGVTSGATSEVGQLVASGNFAAGMATTVTGGLSSVATSLSGMSSSAIQGLSGLVDNAKGLAGSAFSAITKSFKSFVPGIPQNLKEIAAANAKQQATDEAAANAPVANQVAGEIQSSVPSLTGPLTGAVLAAAGPSIVSKVPSVASVASGITSLPGAAGAISSIVGSSGSSLPNLPGVRQAADLIKNTSSAVQNGISNPASILSGNVSLSAGSLSDVANKAESLISNPLAKGLASGTQSLTALASAGLPAGAAASLQASLSSLSSSSPFPIKLPTVGANTTDRGELTAQLSSVLGDKRIPTPNFKGTGPSNAALAEANRLSDLIKEQEAVIKDLEVQGKKIDRARAAFIEARDNLPQGDPAIETAKQAYVAEVKLFGDITDRISTISNKA